MTQTPLVAPAFWLEQADWSAAQHRSAAAALGYEAFCLIRLLTQGCAVDLSVIEWLAVRAASEARAAVPALKSEAA